jgi:hypothetical protein
VAAGRKNLAHQAEAVAVDAAAGHRHDPIADAHGLAINQLLLFDHTHTEAGQVVAPLRIEPRHLGGFTPQ